MALKQELTELEQLVGRLFFNVGVQASLGLEDPNQRFAVEFKEQQSANIKPATDFKDVVTASYRNKTDEGVATLITNPNDMPALARVVMEDGGNPHAVIAALDEAFTHLDNVSVEEAKSFPVREGVVAPEGSGNRFMKLVTAPDLGAKHDVAVLFAWGGISDTRALLDLMTWPVDKPENGQNDG